MSHEISRRTHRDLLCISWIGQNDGRVRTKPCWVYKTHLNLSSEILWKKFGFSSNYLHNIQACICHGFWCLRTFHKIYWSMKVSRHHRNDKTMKWESHNIAHARLSASILGASEEHSFESITKLKRRKKPFFYIFVYVPSILTITHETCAS